MPLRIGIRAGILCGLALAALCGPPAFAQEIVGPFDGSYAYTDIGTPPGVPAQLGGLTLKAGTTDRLLIGGEANTANGALYEIGVVRDASGHITGFSGPATRFADAANNDGGVTYGPGGVLFLARYPLIQLGQLKPDGTTKVIDLQPLGVTGSLGSLMFVPPGQPGAGSLKLASYSGGQWYDAEVVPDGTGSYDLQSVTAIAGRVLSGPEGFVYVNPGSPQFSEPSILVSEYGAGQVAAYAVDANGDPVIASRRMFITGLTGAEGALFDPATGDFLFSTFGGGSRVIVVRGFARQLPPPVAGESVNVIPKGNVRFKLPGKKRFAKLETGQQVPVGTSLDTLKGRVTMVAAADKVGGTAQADFYDGVFKLSQTKAAKPTTTIALTDKLRCGGGGRANIAAKGKKKRRLWGDGEGKFRTDGKHSAATVVGTRWLVEDRCDSTLTKVTRGTVSVRDFARRKTVLVRAGKQYVARRKK